MELAAVMHIKKKVNKANSCDMLVLLCFMQPLAWQSFFSGLTERMQSRILPWDFLGGLVVKTLYFQYRRHEFETQSGN